MQGRLKTSKNLDSVAQEVTEGWIPIHEGTIDHLEKEFSKGTYKASRTALSQDIRQDASLYLYCLKELSAQAQSSGLSPSEIFFYSSLDSIYDSLKRARQHASRHSYRDMTRLQASRLHQTLLSAVASQHLAGSVTIDPDVGYTCGLLRQMGVTLTAWNFPQEYEYAVRSSSQSCSVEERLNSLFGFYPHTLTNALLAKWNLPGEITEVVCTKNDADTGPFLGSSDPKRYEHIQTKLRKICQAAEALARASHPDQNKASIGELEAAEKILKANLGDTALDSIFNEVKLRLRQYSSYELSPTVFPGVKEVKETIVRSLHSLELLERNKSLKFLPDAIREKVEQLYRKLHPEKISKSIVRSLTREIFPELGFARGCVYLFQPEKKLLVPALSIGGTKLSETRPIPITSSLAQYDLIVSAYSLKAPLRSERADPTGVPTTAIAACIGDIAPAGVLYLETKPELLAQIEPDPLVYFQAALGMISDAFNAK